MKPLEKELKEKNWKEIGDWGVNTKIYAKDNLRIMYDVQKDEIKLKYKIEE